MKSLKDLILSRTPIISIPSKMAFYSPNGKLKEVSTLTKGGSISTRNKEKVIQFIGNNDDVFKITNQGYSENNNPQKQEQRGMETEDINIKGSSMKEIKEQKGMGAEDINIKGSSMKEIKEQKGMGAEDINIKGSTMREKKEEQYMGAEDVDIKEFGLKKINFDKLPPITSKREIELNKMKVDELKNILPNEKEYKKMKKDDLIKAILKKEGIRYGLKNISNKNTDLYRQLEKLYKYYDIDYTNNSFSDFQNPYKRYLFFKNKYEITQKDLKEKKLIPNYDYGSTLRMRQRYKEGIDEAEKNIKKYEELLKTDFSPLLE